MNREHSSLVWRWPILTFGAVAGVVLAAAAGYMVWLRDYASYRDTHHQIVTAKVSGIVREIDNDIAVVRSTQALFMAARLVDRDAFRVFANAILDERRIIRALEWVPRVPLRLREHFERQAQVEGHIDFAFREADAAGLLIPAGQREEYYPIYYVEPLAGNEQVAGFDLASHPQRWASMARARDADEIVASESLRLLQQAPNERGILLFAPIYDIPSDKLDERRRRLTGFAVAVLAMPQMLQVALDDQQPQPVTRGQIEYFIFDTTDPGAPVLLHAHRLHPAAEATPDAAMAGISAVASYGVGGRQLQIIARVGTTAFGATGSPAAIIVFMVGLGFAALVLVYMDSLFSRAETVEQLVRDREARLKVVMDSVVDGVITISESGIVQTYNPAAERIFGHKAAQVIGQNIRMLMPEPDRSRHDRYLANYLETGEARIIGKGREVTGLRASGEAFPMELAVSSVNAGGHRLFTGLVRDISDRKQAEEELHKALVQAQLATRTKSEFLANMSHEIRTPMNGIIGLLDLLRTTSLTSEQEHYVTTALSSAELQMNVLNDILDFSKIEAGRLDLEQTPFNPGDLAEDVAALFYRTAENKGLTLACDVAPDLPQAVLGDPMRLKQVLSNLVSNAVKFTARGEVVVRARRLRDMGERSWLRFEVKDTGIGIAPDVRPRLFEAFMQADASMTRRFGGTGLGLAIAGQLIALMEGKIGVDSEPGAGSLFWFEVPLARVQEIVPAGAQPIDGLRVLVVDDNATNRDIMARYLGFWRMEHVEIDDSRKAIEVLREAGRSGKPFHIAVLDYDMPGLDGIALARQIAVESGYPRPQVILASSGAPRTADLQTTEILMRLNKPIRQSSLYDALMHITGGKIESRGGREPPTLAPRALKGPILLVEDTFINRQVALGMLAKLGIEAEVAANGYEALDLLNRGRRYKAALMDIQMPELDGLETTRRIRARETREARPRLPIIAMTAHALTGDRERCLEAGMDDYLAKPIRFEDLEAKLLHLLGGDDGQEVAPGPASTTGVLAVAEDAHLDLAVVRTLRSSLSAAPGALASVLEDFINGTPRLLADIGRAVEKDEPAGAVLPSHSLKSNAATVGARELSVLAREIEIEARAGRGERLAALRAAAGDAFARVRPEVIALLAREKG